MLRQDATATGSDNTKDGLRKRGIAGFAAGTAAAAAMANPFSDENVLFDIADDDDEEEAPSPEPFVYEEPIARSRSVTIQAETPPIEAPAEPSLSVPLIDLTSEPQSVDLHPETHLPSPTPLQVSETEQGAQSFYSFTSSNDGDEDFEEMSAGTLTPRSERSGVTGASIVPSHTDDVAVLSMQNDADHDARSEVFSESGFTDAGYSDFEVGDRTGVITPNSWTDVGSDNESEWGGPQGTGHVSQMHQ